MTSLPVRVRLSAMLAQAGTQTDEGPAHSEGNCIFQKELLCWLTIDYLMFIQIYYKIGRRNYPQGDVESSK